MRPAPERTWQVSKLGWCKGPRPGRGHPQVVKPATHSVSGQLRSHVALNQSSWGQFSHVSEMGRNLLLDGGCEDTSSYGFWSF